MSTLRLVNNYEEVAHDELHRVAEKFGLSVYPKVRVADVIPLDEVGATGDLKSFGLKAHFDFLVCRNKWEPDYAVEFDGRYHSTPVQVERDSKKDELCRRADFPILRINTNHLSKDFGSMSLLAWLVEVNEMRIGFEEAQINGSIPPDEPFDPFFFMSIKPGAERFPYWLSARPLVRLRKMSEKGLILDAVPSGLIAEDGAEVMRGIEYIRLTETEGAFVRTAMRRQQFPVLMSDLLGEILLVQLYSVVSEWARTGKGATPLKEIFAMVDTMQRDLKMLRAHSYGRPPKQS